MIAGKYKLAAALGLVDVTIDTVKGVAALVIHPVDTATALKDYVDAPDLSGRLKEAASDRWETIRDYKSGTSSPANFRAYVKEMASTALDLATVVAPVAAGRTVVKAGASVVSKASKAAISGAASNAGLMQFLKPLPKGVSIGDLGRAAELNAEAFSRFMGETLHYTQNAKGNGIDVFTSKLNPLTGMTEYKFIEVKATAKEMHNARPASLANTNHGKQMGTDWLCKKFSDLHKSDPQLVKDVLHSMEMSRGEVVPSRVLYRPTLDNNFHFENHRLPEFDSIEFHRHLKDIVSSQNK